MERPTERPTEGSPEDPTAGRAASGGSPRRGAAAAGTAPKDRFGHPTHLLAALAERHAYGALTGDWDPFAALFGEDGVLRVEPGDPRPGGGAFPTVGGPHVGIGSTAASGTGAAPATFRGERAVRDALAAASDVRPFRLGPLIGSGPAGAVARYHDGDASTRAGTLRLTADSPEPGRVELLRVLAGVCDVAEPSPRVAARALVIDPAGRVLLLRCTSPQGFVWWITPGGGIDPGEDPVQAATRELREETGLDGVPVSAAVGWREHTFEWGTNVVRQRETFHVVRVPAPFVPCPLIDPAQLAREGLGAHRWWTVREIRASRAEVFAPRRIADLVERIARTDATAPIEGPAIDLGL